MSHAARDPGVGRGLQRRLGLSAAVAIGVGSMIGAGAFAVFAPVTQAAGSQTGVLIALGLACAVAFCNATSTAQLAAAYPSAGGAYLYGRERLGPTWGFAAGWSFVVGKTASCAAMCLVFAAYLVPDDLALQRIVAVAAVIVLVSVNIGGVQRTALATAVLLAVSLAGLAIGAAAGFASTPAPIAEAAAGLHTSAYGVAQAAGLMFFAFAGYARIATLGEEVRNPARTIPRAILIALSATAVLYLVLALALLSGLGPAALASSTAPVADLVRHAGWTWATPLVVAAAAAACLGALLALLAGVGRTSFAMARSGDLPRALHATSRFGTPWLAEVVVGGVVILLVLSVDLREVIGFSSFGVLLYYAVANAAAITQPDTQRRYPPALAWTGLLLCLTLTATLPIGSMIGGAGVVLVGITLRAIAAWRSGHHPRS